MSERSEVPFGVVVPELLRERGMSVRELAGRVGVTAPYLSRATRGVDYKAPSVDLMKRVARVLGKDEHFFLEVRLAMVVERLRGDPAAVDRLFDELVLRPLQRGSRRRG
jgi:transcriptional regulator with XRE-family HTH domain